VIWSGDPNTLAVPQPMPHAIRVPAPIGLNLWPTRESPDRDRAAHSGRPSICANSMALRLLATSNVSRAMNSSVYRILARASREGALNGGGAPGSVQRAHGLVTVLRAILPPSTNMLVLGDAASGCALHWGSGLGTLKTHLAIALDSSVVGVVNVMRSSHHTYARGCMAMALFALVLVPAMSQAKGSRSHSKKQAAVTQNSGTQLPQSTPTSSKSATSRPSPSSVGVIAAPAPASPPAPSAVIGTPLPQLQPPTPLSTPLTLTTPTAGGTARTDSASPSSASPTEAAPTIPGGGGRSLQSCLDFWDPQTHMSKSEWKSACSRSLNRLQNLKVESIGIGATAR